MNKGVRNGNMDYIDKRKVYIALRFLLNRSKLWQKNF